VNRAEFVSARVDISDDDSYSSSEAEPLPPVSEPPREDDDRDVSPTEAVSKVSKKKAARLGRKEAVESGGESDGDAHELKETAFSKRLRNREPLGLEWRDLSLWVTTGRKKSVKRILREVSADCRGGELLAIMGASGAGKTSLLNMLAMRVTGEVRGTVRINGNTFSGRQFRRLTSFVEQDDRLFPWLTVRETLLFIAKLRLPKSMRDADKERLVDDVIAELGLVKCANTIVGSPLVRGVSGGERKRLSIGCELIVDPSILFLDEPTSGLDSNAALNVVETLRALARAGRTVICTIHQPRSGIYSLFDKLLLLAEGSTVYFGPARDAVDYFAELGYACPAFTNPADFFLDITAVNTQSKELIGESKARIRALIAAHAEAVQRGDATPLLPLLPADEARSVEVALRETSSFGTQLWVLTRRTARNLYRDKARTVVRYVSAIVVGILFGFIFYQRQFEFADIQNRTGILFLVATNQAFGGLFAVLPTFLEEREIFQKERALGYYGVMPYFLAKSVAEFPVSLAPVTFGMVLYWIANLHPEVDRFGIFLVFVFLISFVSESLGLFIAALAKSAALANAIAPLFLVFFLVLSGLYLNNDTVPVYMLWLKYLSFIKYGYHGMILNEFEGLEFTVTLPDGTTTIRTGTEVIDALDMEPELEGTLVQDIWILVLMAVLYRFFAYLVLRFLRRGPRMEELKLMDDADRKLLSEADAKADLDAAAQLKKE
jgi:ABC-type multidrug transport system ATPase subunit